MSTKALYLSIFVVFSLACGMQALKVNPTPTAIDTQMTPEMSTDVQMKVTAYTLNVRNSPNGDVLKFYMLQGDKVELYERYYDAKSDIEWCRITPDHKPQRWVSCGWLVEVVK